MINGFEVHEFLFTKNGNFSKIAKRIPDARNYVENLPNTTATFRPNQIPGEDIHRMDNIHFEFVGAWPIADEYDLSQQRGRQFINPNYEHSHRYSDQIVKCGCGAKLTRNYEDGGNALRDEHSHEDGCKPYQRLRARADMSEMRETCILRLSQMGWTGTEIAPRLGMRANTIGGVCQQFGFELEELRKEYRKRAGNSYRYATHVLNEDKEQMANIYGHIAPTLRKWSKKYGTHDYPYPDNPPQEAQA